MRDALHDFGLITLTGGAGNKVCANPADFGLIDARYTKSTFHGTGVASDLAVEVVFTQVVDAGTIILMLEDSANDSSYTAILTREALTTPAKNQKETIPMPKKHRRYVRVTATTSTTVATGLCNAAIVRGPNV